jgi:hypothetical protein
MDEPTKEILVATGKTLLLPAIGAWTAHWWHTRTRSNLPGLQVFPSRSAAKVVPVDSEDDWLDQMSTISAKPKKEVSKPTKKLPAILFEFKNTTREVVFIHRCRLTEITPEFRAHNAAFFDVGERAYELKFRPEMNHEYKMKEIVLQTGEIAQTIMPLAEDWNGEIPRTHKRQWFPPFRKIPKLFCIRYEVSAGNRTYNIRTIF